MLLEYVAAVVVADVHPLLVHDKHVPLLSTPERTLALLCQRKLARKNSQGSSRTWFYPKHSSSTYSDLYSYYAV